MKAPLRAFYPGLSLALSAGGSIAPIAAPGDNFLGRGQQQWQSLLPASAIEALYTTYQNIDLSGLTMGEKTMMPMGYQVSTWGSPEHTWGPTSSSKACMIKQLWVCSDAPIPEEPYNNSPQLITGNMFSLYDHEAIASLIGGSWQSWNTDSAIQTGSMVQVGADSYGNLTPVAADMLYTRCWIWINNAFASSAADGNWEIYPSMITIPQDVKKESELEWIMRLQRLANNDPIE
tara:strand:- start:73 stop:771 length:699 start_codon:yes stop_codon:yes gene_type:complete